MKMVVVSNSEIISYNIEIAEKLNNFLMILSKC